MERTPPRNASARSARVAAMRGSPSSASFIGSVSPATIAFKMRRPLAPKISVMA